MLAVVETHPVQYRAPVYRELAGRLGVPVTAVYGSDLSVAGGWDPEFGQAVTWDTELLAGYGVRFLRRMAGGGARRAEAVRAGGLGAALRALDPRAVLLVGYSPRFHQAAWLQAWRLGRPILFRGETTDHAAPRGWLRAGVRDRALRLVYRTARRVLYVGQRSRAHYLRLGVPPDRLVFSPYCVDAASFATGEAARARLRDETRRALGIPPDALALLFAGKLSWRKGPDLLVEAARGRPPRPGPPVHVVLLGSGALDAELRARAAGPPAVPVHVLGFRNQTALSPVYHAADLLVLPSRHGETWGLVVNEALHHGVPSVVSEAVGSAPDLVHPGHTGEVAPTGSVQGLRAAIERATALTGRPEVRARCRDRAAAYSVARAAEGIAAAYRAVTGAAPAAVPAMAAGSEAP